MKLVPHVHLVDEVAMGTCIILSHVYFNQITQVNIFTPKMEWLMFSYTVNYCRSCNVG